MNEPLPNLDTHFIKSDDFKTIHGSGFYGGFTPAGYLNMVVYTERVPIPKRISYHVSQDQLTVGHEVERDIKTGLIREVQFGMIFDVSTAESLVKWLTNRLEDYRKIQIETSKP